jgi:hypothetical protein
MSGRDEDVVAEVQRDHRSLLRELYAIAKLGPSDQAARLWPVADRLVRRELAMELVVYPAVGELPGADTLAKDLFHEESQILDRVFEIEAERPEAGRPLELQLSRLRVAVADHVGHEEAEVVPLLIGSIPEERRRAMAAPYRAVRDFERVVTEQDPPATRTIVGRLAILTEWIRDSASGNGIGATAHPSARSEPSSARRPALSDRTRSNTERADYSG